MVGKMPALQRGNGLRTSMPLCFCGTIRLKGKLKPTRRGKQAIE